MLANDRNNLEEDIDLLIGADLYWTLVEDKIKRDDNSGLVAIQSKLGWLISGPVEHEKYEFKKDKKLVETHIVNTSNENVSDPFNTKGDITNIHTMLIECKECKESLVLKEELKNFWDLETLIIKEKEKSVYEKFGVRRIAPWKIAPSPPENCPLNNCPLEVCPPVNCPPENSPLEDPPPGELPPPPPWTIAPPRRIAPGELPPGELPPGELPPGELPPGKLPPGELPPGKLHPGELPPGELPPG